MEVMKKEVKHLVLHKHLEEKLELEPEVAVEAEAKVHLDHLALILVHQLRMEAHLMFSLQKVHQDKANQNLQQRSLIHHQLLHQHLLLNHQNQRRLRSQLNHQQIKKHPRKKRLILINQMILKKVIMQNQLLHLLTQQQNPSQSHQSLK